MSLFQILAIVVLGSLLVRDVVGLFQRGNRLIRFVRATVWVVAAVAIAQPLLVQEVAYLLGIGRAADVVLYVFVLAFLWVSFLLYAANLRIQRQLTAIVRHVAIQEAKLGRTDVTP